MKRELKDKIDEAVIYAFVDMLHKKRQVIHWWQFWKY